MLRFLKFVFGPQIHRIHKANESTTSRGYDYIPNSLEYYCDTTLRVAYYFWSFSFYTSPFLFVYMLKNNYFSKESVPFLVRWSTVILFAVVGSMWLRGMARYANPIYQNFIKTLEEAKSNPSPAVTKRIRCYDFDFHHWPVDFKWSQSVSKEATPLGISLESLYANDPRIRRPGIVSKIFGLPCEIISYITMHTFGRWFMYPGHTELLNQIVSKTLQESRNKCVEKSGGLRAKLLSKGDNSIDVMFFDRRQSTHENGQKLVICTEGNAGFYEIGCVVTPLDAHYSVLGWNHPGFGASTGKPYPIQEQAAMEVIVQYAVDELGFTLDNILFFAWSIGGYASTWGAMNYPNISGIVLDATFDDIVPLGMAKMPESIKGFTHRSLRKYMNLNIAEQLIRYQGPIRLIRRSKDEVIITSNEPDVAFNRGNDLLIKIFQHRYPNLMNLEAVDMLTQYLHAADQLAMLSMYNALEIDEDECITIVRQYADKHTAKFPMLIGEHMSKVQRSQLVIFLASKYMTDFEATHCSPLPAALFAKPWSLEDDSTG